MLNLILISNCLLTYKKCSHLSYTIGYVWQNEKILKAKDTISSDQSALQMP